MPDVGGAIWDDGEALQAECAAMKKHDPFSQADMRPYVEGDTPFIQLQPGPPDYSNAAKLPKEEWIGSCPGQTPTSTPILTSPGATPSAGTAGGGDTSTTRPASSQPPG